MHLTVHQAFLSFQHGAASGREVTSSRLAPFTAYHSQPPLGASQTDAIYATKYVTLSPVALSVSFIDEQSAA